MTPERGAPAPQRTVALSVVGAVLVLAVLALAVLAAGGGRWASPPPSATSASMTAPSVSAAPSPPAEETAPPAQVRRDSSAESVPAYLVFVVVLVLVLLGLVLLAGLVHRPAWRRWTRKYRTAGQTVEAEHGGLPEAVGRALVAVDLPDAREAVVQAWLLLGEAAAAAGTPARAAETADEYAARLAEVHGLPTTSLQQLAALYREARFSTHPVRPEQRAQARAELETLRSALAAGTSR